MSQCLSDSEHSAIHVFIFYILWNILTGYVISCIIERTSNYSTFHLRLDGIVKGGLESFQSSDTLF